MGLSDHLKDIGDGVLGAAKDVGGIYDPRPALKVIGKDVIAPAYSHTLGPVLHVANEAASATREALGTDILMATGQGDPLSASSWAQQNQVARKASLGEILAYSGARTSAGVSALTGGVVPAPLINDLNPLGFFGATDFATDPNFSLSNEKDTAQFHHGAAKFWTGSTDAVADMFVDPTIGLGKVAKVAKVAAVTRPLNLGQDVEANATKLDHILGAANGESTANKRLQAVADRYMGTEEAPISVDARRAMLLRDPALNHNPAIPEFLARATDNQDFRLRMRVAMNPNELNTRMLEDNFETAAQDLRDAQDHAVHSLTDSLSNTGMTIGEAIKWGDPEAIARAEAQLQNKDPLFFQVKNRLLASIAAHDEGLLAHQVQQNPILNVPRVSLGNKIGDAYRGSVYGGVGNDWYVYQPSRYSVVRVLRSAFTQRPGNIDHDDPDSAIRNITNLFNRAGHGLGAGVPQAIRDYHIGQVSKAATTRNAAELQRTIRAAEQTVVDHNAGLLGIHPDVASALYEGFNERRRGTIATLLARRSGPVVDDRAVDAAGQPIGKLKPPEASFSGARAGDVPAAGEDALAHVNSADKRLFADQLMAADGVLQSHPLALTQMVNSTPLLDLDVMTRFMQREKYALTEHGESVLEAFSGVGGRLKGSLAEGGALAQSADIGRELLSTFNRVWKPAQLLRFGWPVRVLADEMLRTMAINGVMTQGSMALESLESTARHGKTVYRLKDLATRGERAVAKAALPEYRAKFAQGMEHATTTDQLAALTQLRGRVAAKTSETRQQLDDVLRQAPGRVLYHAGTSKKVLGNRARGTLYHLQPADEELPEGVITHVRRLDDRDPSKIHTVLHNDTDLGIAYLRDTVTPNEFQDVRAMSPRDMREHITAKLIDAQASAMRVGERDAGSGAARVAAADHDIAVEAAHQAAEEATNGHMLSRAGQRAGIDPKSLWTGPEPRARRYASEELNAWWDQNGRITIGDVRAESRASADAERQAAAAERVPKLPITATRDELLSLYGVHKARMAGLHSIERSGHSVLNIDHSAISKLHPDESRLVDQLGDMAESQRDLAALHHKLTKKRDALTEFTEDQANAYSQLISRAAKPSATRRGSEDRPLPFSGKQTVTAGHFTVEMNDAFGGRHGAMWADKASARSNTRALANGTEENLAGLRVTGGATTTMTAVVPKNIPVFKAKLLRETYNRNWERDVNDQIAGDQMMRKVLQGEDRDEILKWMRTTPDGAQYLRKAPEARQQRLEEWVDMAETHINNYLPAPELRQLALQGRATSNDLWEYGRSRGLSDEQMPVIHAQSLDLLRAESPTAHKIQSITDKAYQALGSAPTDTLNRHPYFASIYRKESQKRFEQAVRGMEPTDTVPEHVLSNIEAQSRTAALREVKRTLYDLTNESNLSHTLRFLMPFYSAWQEAISVWAKLISDDPSRLARVAAVWNAPQRSGDTYTDPDGNKFYVVPIPKALRGHLGIPETGIGMPVHVMRDLVLNGNQFWNPGFGPPVMVPLGAIERKMPKTEDFLKPLLPYGPGEGISSQLLPSAYRSALANAQNSQNSEQYAKGLFRNFQDVYTDNRLGKRDDGDQQAMFDEAKRRTDSLFTLKTATSLLLPFSAKTSSPYQFYIDKWRTMQEAQRKDEFAFGRNTDGTAVSAQDAFISQEGEDYFMFTLAASKSNVGGIAPTQAGLAGFDKYKDLVRQMPEMGSLIVGDTAGDYSPAVAEWMQKNAIGPGETTTLRSIRDPKQALTDAETNRGWQLYRQVATAVDTALHARGLLSLRAKGAADIAAKRTILVNKIKADYPAWALDFGTFDRSKEDRRVDFMNKLVDDPRTQDRPGFDTLRTYLATRQLLVGELAKRKTAGGSNDLQARGNTVLRGNWERYVNQLRQSDTVFADLQTRWLSGDTLAAGGNSQAIPGSAQ